jgi:glycosyltransferase involved in cell wall biosynthesis
LKVKGVTRQWEGGGYYRIRQPLEEMAKHGHETSYEMANSGVVADGADVVVGQFIGGQSVAVQANPGVEMSSMVLVHAWWRDLYRKAALVYELDDDPFEVEPMNLTYHVYMNPIAHDSIKHCMEISNLITVSTDCLAERMSKINRNIVVLPNHIPESLLKLQRPQRDRLTIGWAGSQSHIMDIETCAYGLRKTMQRNENVDVHFIGADLRFMVKAPREIRHTGWCANTTDYYELLDFDIGIAPLKPTVFAETKSYLKCLEYAALGIPVVATDVRPYRDFVIDGVTGYLVRKDHEWAVRLRELINDEAMRTEMGAKAREVASHYTIEQGYKHWESAYASLL